MVDEPKKGLLDNVINAVSTRDEVAAMQAAKKEAEAAKKEAEAARQEAALAKQQAAEARARADQELARRQEAELRVSRAEADLKNTRAQADQEILNRQKAEARVKELEAEVARLQQELAQAQVRTYVVKSGDSLSKIAQQFYGDAKRWTEIYEANKDKIKDPNLIHPGQELRIP